MIRKSWDSTERVPPAQPDYASVCRVLAYTDPVAIGSNGITAAKKRVNVIFKAAFVNLSVINGIA